MPKQRVKTEQEKEKKRQTLGTVGWTDGSLFNSVGRVAEEEQGRL
jgi:hypothetical protein